MNPGQKTSNVATYLGQFCAQEEDAMEESVNATISQHFASLKDPRIQLKTRHKLIDIIIITICAVICGADDWVEVVDYAKAKRAWLKTFLELPHGIPSHDTFGRVFSLLRPEEFERCFASWIRAVFKITDGQTVAIDGKTVRRSHERSSNKAPIHMVGAWAAQAGLTLGQVRTEDKSNEITAIPELLKLLEIKGCIVTIDAMGCQKEIARQISDQEADYVLALKGNQGNLRKDVELFFDHAQQCQFKDIPHQSYETTDGDHGRVEVRRYVTVSDLDWLEERAKWKNLNLIGMVQSERHIGDNTTRENRYYIASLPNDVQRFASAVRDHWTIENQLHWVLDIAFREDDSRVRDRNAAANLSTLRRFALSLCKQDRTTKVGIKVKRKRAGWNNDYLLTLLGLS
jgi:predicted transposase YbfD/YdcC